MCIEMKKIDPMDLTPLPSALTVQLYYELRKALGEVKYKQLLIDIAKDAPPHS